MNNRYATLVDLLLVQLFYGLTFTFANDVIVGGHVKPFGFILLRVVCAGLLFGLLGIFTPSKRNRKRGFSKIGGSRLFGMALNMVAFFKGL